MLLLNFSISSELLTQSYNIGEINQKLTFGFSVSLFFSIPTAISMYVLIILLL